MPAPRLVRKDKLKRSRQTQAKARNYDANCTLWLSQDAYAKGRSSFEAYSGGRRVTSWLRCGKLVERFPLLAAREGLRRDIPPGG